MQIFMVVTSLITQLNLVQHERHK